MKSQPLILPNLKVGVKGMSVEAENRFNGLLGTFLDAALW